MILKCLRFLTLEIRRREKIEYISLMDRSEVVHFLKYLFPLLQKPFLDLYAAGNLHLV